MTRFQLTIRCTKCLHRYKRVMEAESDEALAMMPDPPCPNCSKVMKTRGLDLSKGKAPAVTGSLRVRAVDATAQIVMEDHKLTDLRSDVREGETMTPKLPPRQQAMADGFFSRRGGKNPLAGTIMGLPNQQVIGAAVRGRFKTPDTPEPIATHHRLRDAAPTHYVAGDGIRQPRR